MVRRSTPARITDDRFFPVRVRIAVPQGGFDEQLNVMHGWLAGMRRTKLRGLDKVDWAFAFVAAAYNLVRLPKRLAVS
jgi:hypothetical protein